MSTIGKFQGSRVTLLRTRRGLTLEALGEMLGMQRRQIFRYEKEDVDPAGHVVAQLAYHLETTADYLLGLTDDPEPNRFEEPLSPDEAALIVALRNRQTEVAFQKLAALSKSG